MAGLRRRGKGKGEQQELELQWSVATGPAQSHQWPARGDSRAGGDRAGGDIHVSPGEPQGGSTEEEKAPSSGGLCSSAASPKLHSLSQCNYWRISV